MSESKAVAVDQSTPREYRLPERTDKELLAELRGQAVTGGFGDPVTRKGIGPYHTKKGWGRYCARVMTDLIELGYDPMAADEAIRKNSKEVQLFDD